MGKLYRRIVTMGMISLTALLAWVYCMLEYRSEPVYLGGISLIFVGSVYMMLIFIVDLKYLREENLQKYVMQAIEGLKEANAGSDSEETERLIKALYVQVRKVNTSIADMKETEAAAARVNAQATENLKQVITETANKLAKLVVKYSQAGNEETLLALTDIGNRISEANELLESMSSGVDGLSGGLGGITASLGDVADELTNSKNRLENVSDELQDVKGSLRKINGAVQKISVGEVATRTAVPETARIDETPVMVETETARIDETPVMVETETARIDETPVMVETETARIDETPVMSEPEEAIKQEIADAEADLFAEIGISQEDMDALLGGDDVADVIPFPSNSIEGEETDTAPASEEADTASALEEADTAQASEIAETPVIEEVPPAAAPEPADPNKMMSPDEIAALFASMGGGSSEAKEAEPVAEEPAEETPEVAETPVIEEVPVAAPEPADPNKMMTPDEIAALFASAGIK